MPQKVVSNYLFMLLMNAAATSVELLPLLNCCCCSIKALKVFKFFFDLPLMLNLASFLFPVKA
jgi:hypothetical protein